MTWEMVVDMPVMADLVESGLSIVVLISDVEQARDVWNAGVAGILMQNADAQRIATALIAISQGLAVLDQSVVESIAGITTETMIESLAEPLTAREAEVLNLVAEGLSNKAIAFQLGISDHTVKFHVTAIMTKLAAQSRTEAVVKATRLGLIHL
jgi:DNA-binding NarL/FixJ family response regulator